MTAEMRRSPKQGEWLCKDKVACKTRTKEAKQARRKGGA